jgi:streptogramin lyase
VLDSGTPGPDSGVPCTGICHNTGDGSTGIGATVAPPDVPKEDGGTVIARPDNPQRVAWAPTEENSQGVEVTDDGALTLSGLLQRTHAVWTANAGEGTVSRLDIDTGQEVGRYPAIIQGRESEPNYTTTDPSRTAIDFRGDCWVANRYRNTDRPGSVTKIAANERDCVDRNGNDQIDTSRDLNGDGRISLDPNDGEYLDDEDECVLFTVSVGQGESIPRALAIAPDARGNALGGNAWVGLNYGESNHDRRQALELDGNTGEVLREVALDLNPYGALASKFLGRVWFVSASWQNNLPDNPPAIQSINFSTGRVSRRYEVENGGGCVGSYGLSVDDQGRVWVGGRTCNSAFRFDPETETWMTVDLQPAGKARGLVADGEGRVWVAHSADCGHQRCGVISRFNGDDGTELERYYLPEGDGTIGVDLDVNGRVWVVNRKSDSASRIDPATGVIDEFPVGEKPYTYSDFTGHSLYLQFPRGYYRALLEGCSDATWHGVNLDALIPDDTVVEVRVRTAETELGLAEASWVGPWIGSASLLSSPGPVPNGRFAEVELGLRTMRDDGHSPQVYGLDLLYSCPMW